MLLDDFSHTFKKWEGAGKHVKQTFDNTKLIQEEEKIEAQAHEDNDKSQAKESDDEISDGTFSLNPFP